MDQSIARDATQAIMRRLLEILAARRRLRVRDIAKVVGAGVEAALIQQEKQTVIPSNN